MSEKRMHRFTAVITHEGAFFVAKLLEMELASQGNTVDDALANLREAVELYFEDEAAAPVRESVIVRQFEVCVVGIKQ